MGEERFPFDTPSPWEQDVDEKLMDMLGCYRGITHCVRRGSQLDF
jgi:hypothetical protein